MACFFGPDLDQDRAALNGASGRLARANRIPHSHTATDYGSHASATCSSACRLPGSYDLGEGRIKATTLATRLAPSLDDFCPVHITTTTTTTTTTTATTTATTTDRLPPTRQPANKPEPPQSTPLSLSLPPTLPPVPTIPLVRSLYPTYLQARRRLSTPRKKALKPRLESIPSPDHPSCSPHMRPLCRSAIALCTRFHGRLPRMER